MDTICTSACQSLSALSEDGAILTLLIEKAVVWDDRLEMEFKTAGIRSLMEDFRNG